MLCIASCSFGKGSQLTSLHHLGQLCYLPTEKNLFFSDRLCSPLSIAPQQIVCFRFIPFENPKPSEHSGFGFQRAKCWKKTAAQKPARWSVLEAEQREAAAKLALKLPEIGLISGSHKQNKNSSQCTSFKGQTLVMVHITSVSSKGDDYTGIFTPGHVTVFQ